MEVIFLFHVLYCDFLRDSSANPKDVSWDIETKPAGVAVRCSHFEAAKHQNVWTRAKFLLSTRGEGGLAQSQRLGSQLHLKSGRQPQRSVAAVTLQNCCSAALICSWLFFLSFFFLLINFTSVNFSSQVVSQRCRFCHISTALGNCPVELRFRLCERGTQPEVAPPLLLSHFSFLFTLFTITFISIICSSHLLFFDPFFSTHVANLQNSYCGVSVIDEKANLQIYLSGKFA